MGRPPCGTGEGMKKGPWSPEEDIVLASYVQEHGAGNWPSVPRNAGLQRCSQSCRLRWTNYLRPGIKRGDFTPEDDNMIIELRKLFGNSWSSIANYLPGRTDSDIKNYWNHKLKKKIQNVDESERSNVDDATTSSKKRLWATRLQNDIENVKNTLSKALSSASPAAADATTSTTCAAAAPAVSSLPLETVVASSRPPPVSSAGLVNFQPSSPNYNNKQALQVISDAQTSYSYPCSVENIARLLKEWTKETESQRKGDDQFNASNVNKDDANANANAKATNDQGMMNKVDKDDDDDTANKVHYYNYNSTVNSHSPPVPLAVAAPVPFPPTMSAVVPFPPPPAIVSPATTALAAAPAPTAPLDGDDLEEDDNLPELRMSIPYDQNVFWPHLY